jgi:7-keto-8-aminopelargonate synthetase-like enzyme
MSPAFNQLENRISEQVSTNQTSYLYFGGTAYLAAPKNKTLQKLYTEGIQKFGLNNGTSRGNNVQLAIYDQAEAYIAQRYGSESALVSSSGYLAATLTVQSLVGFGELCYAPDTHPALWLADDPAVKKSFELWKNEIVAEINASPQKNWLLLSNSLNNLFPELYDFSFVKEINPDKNIRFIVDDSHGIGLLNDGKSVYSSLPAQKNVKWIVVASMAKALGIDAGLVLADEEIIQQLKLSKVYYGASPPSAAGLYAFMKAEAFYAESYNKLQERITYFSSHLVRPDDWQFVDHFPVFTSKLGGMEQKLSAKNILISSFPYPDKLGKPLDRIVLSAWHSNNQLEILLQALND